jgi:hypothetical protein
MPLPESVPFPIGFAGTNNKKAVSNFETACQYPLVRVKVET